MAAPVVPVFSNARTDTKFVALTFDDGWCATTTELVRQILKKYGVKATIFPAADWAKDNSELMARLASDGHDFGNHTVTHPDLTRLGSIRLHYEISSAHHILQSIVGSRYKAWFRPPYGAYNAAILQAAWELGLRVALWSVDSWDWRDIPSSEVVDRVLRGVRPGSVVLMHLAGRNTVAALPAIITGLRDAGYEFVTLSGLARIDQREPTGPLHSHGIQVILDGQEMQLRPEALLLGGKAYIPCRAFLECLGFRTGWDEKSQVARFSRGEQQLAVQVGCTVASLNGIKLQLVDQPVILGGALYAPVRSLAEALGFEVIWDQAARTVSLK